MKKFLTTTIIASMFFVPIFVGAQSPFSPEQEVVLDKIIKQCTVKQDLLKENQELKDRVNELEREIKDLREPASPDVMDEQPDKVEPCVKPKTKSRNSASIVCA